ncbi:MFS transporter [Ichthyenterobacterium sp. W332]|uniref:MFS transporter n=1 Tax=Microcosmobacter mediterraneus TaxID=3075607 RepID=A0ABU2YKH5_9FLAO|nr:MFS transporter [Ichthyenterobacterium sp. W332]MDT0558668.1 MFS transporter [Ichthyenterobacterium sp. W332]
MKTYEKGSKKLINAWSFYDWANSVYSLVISTAIFPIYYSTVTQNLENADGKIMFLGSEWYSTTLLNYTIGFYMLVVAIISPILSGIADYTGNKLGFLKRFCLLGSLSVMGLFFFKEETLWLGIVLTITAGIGFWGSIVFYNAYLPEVAHPEQQDKVSAKGFIFGYVGSVILLIICLVLIEGNEMFGIDKGLATQLSFILVGLWWLGFAQITYRRLPNNIHQRKPEKDYIWKGFKELKNVAKEVANYPQLKTFLFSFFFFSVSAQTIIYMAGIFGSDELGLPTLNLIVTILLVQLVAVVGAYLFSRLSDKIGNLSTLKITLAIWTLVCFIAFFIDKSQENVAIYFYALGGLLGLVLGAIQSLSRSTYSKLLPETEDTTTYFSFYDVTEKLAIVVGMLVFGLLIALTGGSMQWSVLSLGVFFVIAFIILSTIKKTKYVR